MSTPSPQLPLSYSDRPPDAPATRWAAVLNVILCALLLGLGLALSMRSTHPPRLSFRWLLPGALALVPPVGRAIARLIEAVRRPSPRARRFITLAVTLGSAAYFVAEALHERREFFPKIHDEHMFLLQARMLAQGKLWMEPHPLADFFETFHVLVRPKYAGMYFPGTALFYAMALLLHIPPWLATVGVTAALVGLTYRVMTELIDGAAGLLGALIMISIGWTRLLATPVMSYPLMLMLALAMNWAWLRWRQQRRLRWALAFGALAGWAAITRPLDAFCFALPLAAAIVCELGRRIHRRDAETAEKTQTNSSSFLLCVLRVSAVNPLLRTFAAIALGAAPLLALQIVMNRGVTGRWLQPPVQLFNQHYWPGNSLGFKSQGAGARPPTALPQFQDFFDQFHVPTIEGYRITPIWAIARGRLPGYFDVPLAPLPLAPLALVGLPGLLDRRRWPLAAALPLLFCGYLLFPSLLGQYLWLASPTLILALLLGAQRMTRAARDAWGWLAPSRMPALRSAAVSHISAAITLGIAFVCVRALLEFPPLFYHQIYDMPILTDVNAKLASLEHTPAVVLFRYSRGDDPLQEPVYNTDTAWPDDAPVIKAHDLGDTANRRIYHYYADRQPRRFFYRYVLGTRTLEPLGWADELARKAGE